MRGELLHHRMQLRLTETVPKFIYQARHYPRLAVFGTFDARGQQLISAIDKDVQGWLDTIDT